MRILIYCQHLLGVGHLTRVLNISEHLLPWAEVHLLQGGPEAGKTIIHKNFHHHKLPPLLMHEESKQMYDPSGSHPLQEILDLRTTHIKRIAQLPFDAVLIELFPFGRNKLKEEIQTLISQLRSRSPQIPAFCSLRDIVVKKNDFAERDKKIADKVNKFFDIVLVHADSRVIRLEESFSQVPAIESKIHYTGFIGPQMSSKQIPRDPKRIVISQGGSDVGLDFLLKTLPTAALLPDFQLHLVLGSRTPADKKAALQNSALKFSNVTLHDFMTGFPEFLAGSALSISMGGYNTLMELLQTRTPSLILPYQADGEQRMRTEKFAEKGLVHLLEEKDLESQKLAEKIRSILALPYPDVDVSLNGAACSALLMKEFIETRDL